MIRLREVHFEHRRRYRQLARCRFSPIAITSEHRERDVSAVGQHGLRNRKSDGIRSHESGDHNALAVQEWRHGATRSNRRSIQPR